MTSLVHGSSWPWPQSDPEYAEGVKGTPSPQHLVEVNKMRSPGLLRQLRRLEGHACLLEPRTLLQELSMDSCCHVQLRDSQEPG